MLNTPATIERMRWCTLRSGFKLECKGLRKRGTSCTSIIKRELGLPLGAQQSAVEGALERKFVELNAAVAEEQANAVTG